jgi:hypothetical protein
MTAGLAEQGALPARRAAAAGTGQGFWLVNLGLAVVVVALFVMAHLSGLLGAKPGRLADSDCYVHLLRAEKLWQTGRWYDPVLERSNTPFGGEELHWTRPFDVLLLVGGVPASLLVGLRSGLFWWGVLLSPVLLGVTLILLPWAMRPLLGREGAFTSGIIFLCQLGILTVFQAARPDHHSLLLLLFVFNLGLTLRLIEQPLNAGVCYAAGIVAALALWVSIESSVAIAASLVVLAALWIIWGGEFLRKTFHYTVALALGLVAALVVERPPTNLLAVEFDRLSIAHCAVFGLIAAFWGAVLVYHKRYAPLASRTGRLLALLVGMAGCGVVTLTFLPSWYEGPFAKVNADVMRIYVQRVAEMQPLLQGDSPLVLGVPFVGAALLSLPLLAWRSVRGPRACGWLYVAVALLAFVPLSLLQVRWTAYAQVLFSLTLTEMIVTVWACLDRRPHTLKRTLVKTGIWAACCCFLLVSGIAADTAFGVKSPQNPAGYGSLTPLCRYLAETPPYASHRQRILADVSWGGEILYRTPHEVVGTPLHRNTRGILDTHRAFNAATDDEALQVIRERRINLIIVCPGSGEVRRSYRSKDQTSSFYERLCEGKVPSWCREVPLPPELAAFRLFEVREK